MARANTIPKLSDITTVELENNPVQTDFELMTTKNNYNQEMDTVKKDIKSKIKELEKKISNHDLKVGMMDRIIAETSRELDSLQANEFTRRGQKQTILIKQLEAISIIHDTIIKYQDMVQKYHKIILDIENNKLNGFVKLEGLKVEEKVADEGISGLLVELQKTFRANESGETKAPLLADIEQELSMEDY